MQDLTWNYDANKRLTSETDAILSGLSKNNIGYDDEDRLTSYTSAGTILPSNESWNFLS